MCYITACLFYEYLSILTQFVVVCYKHVCMLRLCQTIFAHLPTLVSILSGKKRAQGSPDTWRDLISHMATSFNVKQITFLGQKLQIFVCYCLTDRWCGGVFISFCLFWQGCVVISPIEHGYTSQLSMLSYLCSSRIVLWLTFQNIRFVWRTWITYECHFQSIILGWMRWN